MNHSFGIIARFVVLTVFIFLTTQVSAVEPITYEDSFEKWNRKIFRLNDVIDKYTLKPVAQTYDFLTPKPVQNLVGNFFSNLGEIRNIVSASVQFKGHDALVSSGRLIINSTAGMFGLIDLATPMGLDRRYSDFGLALANFGLPSGPYIILPLFGPSTVRAGIGSIPDGLTSPITYIEPERGRIMLRMTGIINDRTRLLDAEDLILGDRYTFVRDSYLQRREYLITGQQPEDDF